MQELVPIDQARVKVLLDGKYLDQVEMLEVSRDGKPKSEGMAAIRYLLAPESLVPKESPMDVFIKPSKKTADLDT